MLTIGSPQNEEWNDDNLKLEWDTLKSLKSEVNQVLEYARQDKCVLLLAFSDDLEQAIRGSQEATVEVHVDPKSSVAKLLRKHGESELAALFITSGVKLVDADPAVDRGNPGVVMVPQTGSHEKRVVLQGTVKGVPGGGSGCVAAQVPTVLELQGWSGGRDMWTMWGGVEGWP
ncbi:hypothetical protein BC936DRAFT_139073 [Jimgerdemannia flammicorona]|uniref:Uncharacterized protein n=1 Tax=Jimgerdemannia flammicorona TaxID=994334 RepID=A0A433BAQ5_9FUNG|nr:hypothetical protein BC936DRAFT_139073 [Jimgerdemannia flammicorona]